MQYVRDFLACSTCSDCPENDPIVLEFDHVRGTKLQNITDMIGSNSIESIQEEIDKCEVRCANCHKRKTAKQLGFYSYLDTPDS